MPSENAPVAQLDRAPDYESGGQEFESLRARHQFQKPLFSGNNSIAQWLRSAALVSSGRINDACWNGFDKERTWRFPCAQEGTEGSRSRHSKGHGRSQGARLVAQGNA